MFFWGGERRFFLHFCYYYFFLFTVAIIIILFFSLGFVLKKSVSVEEEREEEKKYLLSLSGKWKKILNDAPHTKDKNAFKKSRNLSDFYYAVLMDNDATIFFPGLGRRRCGKASVFTTQGQLTFFFPTYI